MKKIGSIHTTVVADNSRTPMEIREFWGGTVYGQCIEIVNRLHQLEPGAVLTLDAAEELLKNFHGVLLETIESSLQQLSAT